MFQVQLNLSAYHSVYKPEIMDIVLRICHIFSFYKDLLINIEDLSVENHFNNYE